MNKCKDPDRPAFPNDFSEKISHREGMKLRDYFAGMAMQELIKTYSAYHKMCYFPDINEVAVHAYYMADAMMEARNE